VLDVHADKLAQLPSCASNMLQQRLTTVVCGAEAYDVLSDPNKRAVYDRYGEGKGGLSVHEGRSAFS